METKSTKEEIEILKKEIEDLKAQNELQDLKATKEKLSKQTTEHSTKSNVDISLLLLYLALTITIAIAYYFSGWIVQFFLILFGFLLSIGLAGAINKPKSEVSKKKNPFFAGATLAGCGLFIIVFLVVYVCVFTIGYLLKPSLIRQDFMSICKGTTCNCVIDNALSVYGADTTSVLVTQTREKKALPKELNDIEFNCRK